MLEVREKLNQMNKLIYISLIFFISCGTSKKIKSVTKSELIEVTDSVSVQSVETIEISEKEIKEVLSSIDFEFVGKQTDSAQIEIKKTDNSIIVKVSGKAQAKLKATEQIKAENNTNISGTKQTAVKRTETAKKETTQAVTKEKQQSGSFWWWLIIGAAVVCLLLYIKKRLHL